MTILVRCPMCERPAKVPQDAAGRTARCTGCKETFTVPLGSGDLTVEWGPTGAGRRIPLSPDETATIGRARQNTLSLPGPLVSRLHATMEWVDYEWKLRDTGSTNGVFVNGQRVKEIGLTDGSRIVLGDFALRLSVATAGPSDFDTALDAMAVEETKAGMLAVVDTRDGRPGPADTRAETAWGEVPLTAPEEDEAAPTPRRRGLLERWPVVVILAVFVVLAILLLIRLLT